MTMATSSNNEPYHNSPWINNSKYEQDVDEDDAEYDRAQLELTRERSRDSLKRAQKIKRRTQEWKDILRDGREQSDLKEQLEAAVPTTNIRDRKTRMRAIEGDDSEYIRSPAKPTATKTARQLKAERLRIRAEIMHNAKNQNQKQSNKFSKQKKQVDRNHHDDDNDDDNGIVTIQALRDKREQRRLEEARVKQQKQEESKMDKAQLLELEMASPPSTRSSTMNNKTTAAAAAADIRPKPTAETIMVKQRVATAPQLPPRIVTPPSKQDQSQSRGPEDEQQQQQPHNRHPAHANTTRNWKVTDKGGSTEWMENLFENMCCINDDDHDDETLDDDTYITDANTTQDDSAAYTDSNKHYKDLAAATAVQQDQIQLKRKPSYNDYAIFYQ